MSATGNEWGSRAESLERMASPAADLKSKLIADPQADSECEDWSDDDGPAATTSLAGRDVEAGDEEDPDDKSLCVALCTLALAIPALVGSWCWPILVGAMFAVAASNVNGGLVAFFHGVQVAVMFALMTNILQFAWWKLKKKKGTYWQRRGPLWILLAAMFMVCTQPVAMLVVGSWEDMPNFFFDGGDTGDPCTANSQCGSRQCVTTAQDTTLLVENLWHMTGCDPTFRAPSSDKSPYWDIPGKSGISVEDVVMPLVGGADSLADSATIVKMFYQICTDTTAPLHNMCNPNNQKCTDLSDPSKSSFTTSDPKADTYLNTADCQCAKGNYDAKEGTTSAAIFDAPWLNDPHNGVTCGCSCAINSNMLVPNTPIGLFIQIFCTYGGFILMFTGVFMATNLHIKIANMWKALRKKF